MSIAFLILEYYNPAAMANHEISVPINAVRYVGETQISSLIVSKEKKATSNTALHEAAHAIVASIRGTLDSVTTTPGPGYLGLTRVRRPDIVAAMAAHADGMSGTGHDVRVAGMLGNPAAAEHTAKGMLEAHRDEQDEVALALDEKRFLTSGEVNTIMRRTRKQRGEVLLIIKNPGEKEKKATVKAVNGVVMVPGEWVAVKRNYGLAA